MKAATGIAIIEVLPTLIARQGGRVPAMVGQETTGSEPPSHGRPGREHLLLQLAGAFGAKDLPEQTGTNEDVRWYA